MGTKTEMLAKQFEAKARDALATLESLSDADWKKVTAAEQWSSGLIRHVDEHVGSIRKTVGHKEPLESRR